MEITILVKSSSQSEPRTVQVTQDDSGVSIFCDCPAGNWGRICKHKIAVASGNDRMLYDEDQRENFAQVMDWVADTAYPVLMQELITAEKEQRSSRDKVKELKEKIAQAMNDGLK